MIDGASPSLIDNRYRPSDLVGRGGMGEVYLARDEVLYRDVAVKILARPFADDEESVERFRREARSAAALSHPNIVPVYDLGETDDGAQFIVMEYVSGGTLKELILREGPLEARAAVKISHQVARALGAAHDGGVIHRDVKPQNVLFTVSGEAKLTDFGIARAASAPCMTRTGFALGTADYMSPEQAMGEEVGPASDLYSLGVVLYQMLTGERPFEADSPLATAIKHINELPPRLYALKVGDSHFPGGMEVVVGRLLAKNQAERYDTASELIADLELVGDRLTQAESPGRGFAREYAVNRRAGSPGLRPGGARAGDRAEADTVVGVAARKRRSRKRLSGYLAGAAALSVAALLGAAGVLGLAEAGAGEVLRNFTGGANERSEAAPAPTGPAALPAAEAPEPVVFASVHRAAPGNISGNSTYIDNSRVNGNPDAIISVTQNWNPGNDNGTYNDRAVGVWYDSGAGRWAIFNQDRADMSEGTAFNVTVLPDARKTS
ncbi:protein kinase domain-containing protein [Rubrobacter indicoceani]|uniref:protein kinase domain-containing protein n=1 Tax=Rubrobacter indicoceani TaxID=2051957 RepID=UPI000E5C271C|nr:protein kinase [Rubrobacter indicoceani]